MNISDTSNHTFRTRLWMAARIVGAVFLVAVLVFVGIVIYHRHVDNAAGGYAAPTYPITTAQAGFVKRDTVQVHEYAEPSPPAADAPPRGKK